MKGIGIVWPAVVGKSTLSFLRRVPAVGEALADVASVEPVESFSSGAGGFAILNILFRAVYATEGAEIGAGEGAATGVVPVVDAVASPSVAEGISAVTGSGAAVGSATGVSI